MIPDLPGCRSPRRRVGADGARIAGHLRRSGDGDGHDAFYMARVAPTAMIFVPSKDGISHNEVEDASPADLAAGCNVLLNAVLGAAGP